MPQTSHSAAGTAGQTVRNDAAGMHPMAEHARTEPELQTIFANGLLPLPVQVTTPCIQGP
jgi:hypothetical protein